jgi:hypothetical protein
MSSTRKTPGHLKPASKLLRGDAEDAGVVGPAEAGEGAEVAAAVAAAAVRHGELVAGARSSTFRLSSALATASLTGSGPYGQRAIGVGTQQQIPDGFELGPLFSVTQRPLPARATRCGRLVGLRIVDHHGEPVGLP